MIASRLLPHIHDRLQELGFRAERLSNAYGYEVACQGNVDDQIDFLNRFFNRALSETEDGNLDARACLNPNVTSSEWKQLFEKVLVPNMKQNGLLT